MKLSLVIPCYNEADNLPLILERCDGYRGMGVEVILVDNGSTDDTPEVMQKLLLNHHCCRSIRIPVNQGYGYGICSGLKVAKGEVLAWTHADMQTDPMDALKGLELFELHGHNIFVKGRRIKRPIFDAFFTIGMSVFETFLLRTRLWDINAQPNMFSRTFYETWVHPPNDFALDLYVYFEARNQNHEIHRFPVEFKERLHGVSHWNINWRAKMKFILRTVTFSFELKKRRYK